MMKSFASLALFLSAFPALAQAKSFEMKCSGTLNICIATSQDTARAPLCWSNADLVVTSHDLKTANVKVQLVPNDSTGVFSVEGTMKIASEAGAEDRSLEMHLKYSPVGFPAKNFKLFWVSGSDQTDLQSETYEPVALYTKGTPTDVSPYQQVGIFRCYFDRD